MKLELALKILRQNKIKFFFLPVFLAFSCLLSCKEAGLSTAWIQLRLEGKAVSYALAYDEKYIEDLNKAALHDPLTGTSNRLCIESKLRASIEGKRRFNTSLGVLFIDIDISRR